MVKNSQMKDFLLGLIVLFLVGILFLFKIRATTGISGTINLNGIVPKGSVITIFVKGVRDQNFKTALSGILALDGVSWSWNEAKEKQAYVVRAVLNWNGKEIGQSQNLLVAAPAHNEVLTINSTYKSESTPSIISGQIELNGALGAQNSISIFAKQPGGAEFALITDQVQAAHGAVWEWREATSGTHYEIKAELYVDGSHKGSSKILKITAPATSEVLSINSTYQPKPEQTTVSGSININGKVSSLATVSIYKKAPHDSSFVEVVSGITPTDAVAWSWNKAQVGVQYKLKAIMWLRENDIGDSQILFATAPASNEVLTLEIRN